MLNKYLFSTYETERYVQSINRVYSTYKPPTAANITPEMDAIISTPNLLLNYLTTSLFEHALLMLLCRQNN